MSASQESLNRIRRSIDALDARLVRLLMERVELALQAGKIKETPLDREREEAVLRNVERLRQDPLPSEVFAGLYRQIIRACRSAEEKNPSLVAFQGARGAYSEEAALAACPGSVPIPFPAFRDVFDAVRDRRVDWGLLPVENSTEGAVTEVNDLLLEYDLFIIKEVCMPVHHQLLVVPGSDSGALRTACSHPQALAQCREFLRRRRLTPHPVYDTAGAARDLSETPMSGVGVIASRRCSLLYGLDIAAENIEDDPSNQTRFLVISREENTGDALKGSLACTVAHEPGALWEVLGILRDHGINLVRIESRPMKAHPGFYVFFMDFAGSPQDAEVAEALSAVRDRAVFWKFLGGYTTLKV